MKLAHWAAIVVLVLMSLMNLGTVTGDSTAAVVIIGIAIGVAGLVAAYGLIRHTSWGPLAALAAAGAFLVTSVIGLLVGWDGSPIGIGVSMVALILIALGEVRQSAQHRRRHGQVTVVQRARRTTIRAALLHRKEIVMNSPSNGSAAPARAVCAAIAARDNGQRHPPECPGITAAPVPWLALAVATIITPDNARGRPSSRSW